MGLGRMRKKTIRNGMRLVVAALLLIIMASFYHDGVGNVFSFTYDQEMHFYQLGIFLAAAMGGYGVVASAFGLVLPARHQDSGIRIIPSLFLIIFTILFFFYLLVTSFDSSIEPIRDRLRPGESITI